MPSSGYFPFPAHGEPERGSARRQSSVLAGKLLFATTPAFFPARFQRFSRYRLLLLAPFLRRRGSFCSGTLLFRPSISKFPFLILYFEKQKRRMRTFHSPVCDSVFLGLSGQKSDDMSSRPTKILKMSAFRDFFVTEPKCQKGAKNRVKTRFLRRISILFTSVTVPPIAPSSA